MMRKVGASIGLMVAMGCSVPDGGDLSKLEDEIRAMPQAAYKPLSDWVFENVVSKYMWDHGDDPAADQRCWDKDGNKVWDSPLTLDDLAVCLHGSQDWTAAGWSNCLNIVSPFLSDLVGPDGRCETTERVRFSWIEIVDRAAAENQDQINRGWISLMATTIIASPVAPPSIARLLPTLCGLSVPWGCPGAPGYPGDTPVIDPAPAPGDDAQ